jgi:hypothetical protein
MASYNIYKTTPYWVLHPVENPRVGGSNPPPGTIFYKENQILARISFPKVNAFMLRLLRASPLDFPAHSANPCNMACNMRRWEITTIMAHDRDRSEENALIEGAEAAEAEAALTVKEFLESTHPSVVKPIKALWRAARYGSGGGAYRKVQWPDLRLHCVGCGGERTFRSDSSGDFRQDSKMQTGPVVPGRTRLNSDQARRQCLEESCNIVAAKPAAAHDRASTIDSVNLKYMLGDIQTNCGNLLHGRFSLM